MDEAQATSLYGRHTAFQRGDRGSNQRVGARSRAYVPRTFFFLTKPATTRTKATPATHFELIFHLITIKISPKNGEMIKVHITYFALNPKTKFNSSK